MNFTDEKNSEKPDNFSPIYILRKSRAYTEDLHSPANTCHSTEYPYEKRNTNEKIIESKPGLWAKYSNHPLSIIFAAFLGLALGLLFKSMDVQSEWISLPGDLFIKGLKCIVLPVIFTSLLLGVADILSIGKFSSIGRLTLFFFVLTTFSAATLGNTAAMLTSFVVKNDFASTSPTVETDTSGDSPSANITTGTFFCDAGYHIQVDTSLWCAKGEDLLIPNITITSSSSSSAKSNTETVSLSNQIHFFVSELVSDNILKSFSEGSLLAVITFGIVFGIALVKMTQKQRMENMDSANTGYMFGIIRELNHCLIYMVEILIQFAPIAVIFMVSGSIAKNADTHMEIAGQIGYLFAALVCAAIVHTLVVLPALFFIFLRQNPYTYLRAMIPAQGFAFGCASSLATLPVTLRCIDTTRQISRLLSRFVVVLGTPLNMNGTAIYLPLAVNFLVMTSPHVPELTQGRWILLNCIAAITSLAGAPVPNAGLVMAMTVYRTVVNEPVPDSISVLFAIDWLLDRIRTPVNVTGNTVVVRIIAARLRETYADEESRMEEL